MRKIIFSLSFLWIINICSAQFQKDRVCSSSRHIDECNQLQRGNSEVNCVFAQDAVECAHRIRNGTAEFGVLTAENAYLLGTLDWRDLTVIKEIRHIERLTEPVDFQSVVIVRSDHVGGLENLRNNDYCHPGLHYERHQRWTERFLKEFERRIVRQNCTRDGRTPAELEVAGLANIFNAACRPGSWSNEPQEDRMLKEKYPQLCSLCDHPSNCTYGDAFTGSSHRQALECLRKSGNAVTYVALQEAQNFFNDNSDIAIQYSFLCPNGSLQPIADNNNPCVWLSQPWSLIVSNNEKAIGLSTTINRWMTSNSGWESSLRQILTPDSSQVVNVRNIQQLPDYIAPIRAVPVAIDVCANSLRWCTHSYDEKEKCEVLRAAALTTGIQPLIICNEPRSDTVSCISDVSSNKADFVGIDSNFGYLARNPYNLTAALFEETEFEKYSSVVALINQHDAERITRFEDFRDRKACFAEYGGIASIEFINIAKNRGIFKREDCNFGKLLGSYFNDSCLPGSRSVFHDPSVSNPESLCSLCQTQLVMPTTTMQPIRPMADVLIDDEEPQPEEVTEENEIEGSEGEILSFIPNRSINCAAAPSNRFYGTRGALTCLKEVGEVAVLEYQNLAAHAQNLSFNPNDFRILCRNGSLAANPGFNVDPGCFLTTIIDGEVVVPRNTDKKTAIINILLSLDKYLQNDPDFKMYNIFNGEKNLLFEDSSLGLVSPNDTALSQSVQNYIQLFTDVENCISDTAGAQIIAVNLLLTFVLVLLTTMFSN
ncbi:CLUMA_CG011066, isoform A [Clunio marinus]|uniref:CLUMA_CG011066, isoform A n=1 Tax=Clunio marinus TaxID=568069 RepID=A0A1J1IFB0_9DIPT|nr:CLUMA_CG011066, isoform A [Clunio marinus]